MERVFIVILAVTGIIGITDAVLYLAAKAILKEHGHKISFFLSRVEDLKRLKNIGRTNKSIYNFYVAYLSTTILTSIAVLSIIIITIILTILY